MSLGDGGEVGVGATLQNVTKKQWGKGADAPWSYSHAARRTMFKLLQKHTAGSYKNAHEAPEFNADGHVGKHESDGLVVDDGGAHGFALFGIANRRRCEV